MRERRSITSAGINHNTLLCVASELRVDCRLPVLGGGASESQSEVVEGHTPLLWIDMLPFVHVK